MGSAFSRTIIFVLFCNDGKSLSASRTETGNELLPVSSQRDPANIDARTIVGTADGAIHVFDSDKNMKWSATTGGPMTTFYNSGDLDYSVIPSTDGSLLVSTVDGMRKTSVKARMLVENTPFGTSDGLIFTSQKNSRLLGFDLGSGKVLHDLPSEERFRRVLRTSTSSSSSPHSLPLEKDKDAPTSSTRAKKPLWIGRTDYVFRAFNEITGLEQFNFTYSEMRPISRPQLLSLPLDSCGGAGGSSNPNTRGAGDGSRNNRKQQRTKNKYLVSSAPQPLISTPDGDLYFADDQGIIHRTHVLDSPAVAAFDMHSGSGGYPSQNQHQQRDTVRPMTRGRNGYSNSNGIDVIRPLHISHRMKGEAQGHYSSSSNDGAQIFDDSGGGHSPDTTSSVTAHHHNHHHHIHPHGGTNPGTGGNGNDAVNDYGDYYDDEAGNSGSGGSAGGGGTVVLVRSLNDGHLYALEINNPNPHPHPSNPMLLDSSSSGSGKLSSQQSSASVSGSGSGRGTTGDDDYAPRSNSNGHDHSHFRSSSSGSSRTTINTDTEYTTDSTAISTEEAPPLGGADADNIQQHLHLLGEPFPGSLSSSSSSAAALGIRKTVLANPTTQTQTAFSFLKSQSPAVPSHDHRTLLHSTSSSRGQKPTTNKDITTPDKDHTKDLIKQRAMHTTDKTPTTTSSLPSIDSGSDSDSDTTYDDDSTTANLIIISSSSSSSQKKKVESPKLNSQIIDIHYLKTRGYIGSIDTQNGGGGGALSILLPSRGSRSKYPLVSSPGGDEFWESSPSATFLDLLFSYDELMSSLDYYSSSVDGENGYAYGNRHPGLPWRAGIHGGQQQDDSGSDSPLLPPQKPLTLLRTVVSWLRLLEMYTLRVLLLLTLLVFIVLIMLQRGVPFPKPVRYLVEAVLAKLGQTLLPERMSMGLVNNRLNLFSSGIDDDGDRSNPTGGGGRGRHDERDDTIVEVDEHGQSLTRVGALVLSSEVLGYGSHGTVVFKGSLNGRPVAIKRMLSRFDRAAEREVSLLIKSDGHPNVVRYFLRESRSEFVYLALQLCRMSLREFVTRLQKGTGKKRKEALALSNNSHHNHESTESAASNHSNHSNSTTTAAAAAAHHSQQHSDEVRRALKQIAEGLAHLHSQRIVHRDIKPHNILCSLPDDNTATNTTAAASLSLTSSNKSNHADPSTTLSSSSTTAAAATTAAASTSDIVSLDQLGAYILKISDMGLSKQLDHEDGSFASMSMSMPMQAGERDSSSNSHSHSQQRIDYSPVGTIGWQAPELLSLRVSSAGGGLADYDDVIDGEEEEEEDEGERHDNDNDRGSVGGDNATAGDRDTASLSLEGDGHDDPTTETTTVAVRSAAASGGSGELSERSIASSANTDDNNIYGNKNKKAAAAVSNTAAPPEPSGRRKKTQKCDVFSCGCVFYYVLVPGYHPFGQWYEREANIMSDTMDISALNQNPDALDLITKMLYREPDDRPTAAQVCNHPFFWPSQKRLEFLVDLSDRLEHEAVDSPIVLAIEANAPSIVGRNWDKKLHPALLEDMSRYRKYDTASVRDLLRVIRNKRHHFHELSEEVKTIMSPLPSGFVLYFEKKYPRLLMHGVEVACRFLSQDKDFTRTCGPIKPMFVPSEVRSDGSERDHITRNHHATAAAAATATAAGGALAISGGGRGANSTDTSAATAIPIIPIDTKTTNHHSENRSSGKSTTDKVAVVAAGGYGYGYAQQQQQQQQSDKIPTAADIHSGNYSGSAAASAGTISSSTSSAICQLPATAGSAAADTQTHTVASAHHLTTTATALAGAGSTTVAIAADVVVWQGSALSSSLQSRGWWRDQVSWTQPSHMFVGSGKGSNTKASRPVHLTRSSTDLKYRSRLCTHWEMTGGTGCPMRKKGKCDFAHGPLELRVKENRRGKWSSSSSGIALTGSSHPTAASNNSSNSYSSSSDAAGLLRISGGEDILGAARSIERLRAAEGSVSDFERSAQRTGNSSKHTTSALPSAVGQFPGQQQAAAVPR